MANEIEAVYYDYCDAVTKQYKCLSTAIYYFTDWHSSYSYSSNIDLVMEIYDKKPLKSLHEGGHVFCTIATILCWFILARVCTQFYTEHVSKPKRWLSFLIEFILIALPCIVCVNLANKWVECIVLAMTVLLCLIVWYSKCNAKAKDRQFELGNRPHVFTLLRSTVYIWTVLCILAIDFDSFPRDFRKSRSYGASLMDVGIGLFVTVMAMVSKRMRSFATFQHTLIAVVALLLLGTSRTVLVMYLNYGQDDHEYGRHMNAFFILAFTKLFGTLCSWLARSDVQLLPLSIGIIAAHELVLQGGLQDYVIDPSVSRSNFLDANREGLASIPGFVGLYLLCIFIYRHLNIKGTLSYTQLLKRLKTIFMLVVVFIFLTVCSSLSIGISRVTCNFGYIVWMIAITITMTLLCLLVFEYILNTIMPIAETISSDQLEKSLLPVKNSGHNLAVPLMTQAINLNGLIYFLIGNLLTGFVNIFLSPDIRTDLECILILTIYLFINTAIVFVMFCLKLRIA